MSEIFERVIFMQMKTVFSPFEISARTASAEWLRGAIDQAASLVEIEFLCCGHDHGQQIQRTGADGTGFRPLIEAAAEYEPDALVYLTNLYGETGDAPDFPVIRAMHGKSGGGTVRRANQTEVAK